MEEKCFQLVVKKEEKNLLFNVKNTIKKNNEFKKVYEAKNSFATKNIVLYVFNNVDMERNRLGISVSKKVGNSIVRHRLTRRMREIFRKIDKNLKKSFDIVVLFRIGSDKKEFLELKEDFIKLCMKHGILIEKE